MSITQALLRGGHYAMTGEELLRTIESKIMGRAAVSWLMLADDEKRAYNETAADLETVCRLRVSHMLRAQRSSPGSEAREKERKCFVCGASEFDEFGDAPWLCATHHPEKSVPARIGVSEAMRKLVATTRIALNLLPQKMQRFMGWPIYSEDADAERALEAAEKEIAQLDAGTSVLIGKEELERLRADSAALCDAKNFETERLNELEQAQQERDAARVAFAEAERERDANAVALTKATKEIDTLKAALAAAEKRALEFEQECDRLRASVSALRAAPAASVDVADLATDIVANAQGRFVCKHDPGQDVLECERCVAEIIRAHTHEKGDAGKAGSIPAPESSDQGDTPASPSPSVSGGNAAGMSDEEIGRHLCWKCTPGNPCRDGVESHTWVGSRARALLAQQRRDITGQMVQDAYVAAFGRTFPVVISLSRDLEASQFAAALNRLAGGGAA